MWCGELFYSLIQILGVFFSSLRATGRRRTRGWKKRTGSIAFSHWRTQATGGRESGKNKEQKCVIPTRSWHANRLSTKGQGQGNGRGRKGIQNGTGQFNSTCSRTENVITKMNFWEQVHSLGKSTDLLIYWKNLSSLRDLARLSVVEYMYIQRFLLLCYISRSDRSLTL